MSKSATNPDDLGDDIYEQLWFYKGEPGDLAQLSQHIVGKANAFFGADICVLTLPNPSSVDLLLAPTVAGSSREIGLADLQPAQLDSFNQQIAAAGALFVADLTAQPQFGSPFTTDEKIRAVVVLALCSQAQNRPLAYIYLYYRLVPELSDPEKRRLEIFAREAARLLQENWLLHCYQVVAEIGLSINAAAVAASVEQDEAGAIRAIFHALAASLANIIDIRHTLMLIINQPEQGTCDRYLLEDQQWSEALNIALTGGSQWALEQRQTLFINNLDQEAPDLPVALQASPGTAESKAIVFAPILLGAESLGVLSAQHTVANSYSKEDRFILELVANQFALALTNMRLFANMGKLVELGQTLTQELESEQLLAVIGDQILSFTHADIVVLHLYDISRHTLLFPPAQIGELYATPREHPVHSTPDNIATLTLQQGQAVWAKDSKQLYALVSGTPGARRGRFEEREKIKSTAALPLRVGANDVGVLFVNFRQPQEFNSAQKRFITGLAQFAAIALKNAQRVSRQTQRHNAEQKVLRDIEQQLAATSDLQTMMEQIIDAARQHIAQYSPVDEASILLYDAEQGAITHKFAAGSRSQDSLRRLISEQIVKGGIVGQALLKRESKLVDDVQEEPWRSLYIGGNPTIHAELDVLIMTNAADDARIVGVFNFESKTIGAFKKDDRQFLITLADQVVRAISRAREYAVSERIRIEAERLKALSLEIARNHTAEPIYDKILADALELTRATVGSIQLYDPQREELTTVAIRGATLNGNHRESVDRGVVGWVAKNRSLANVRDIDDPIWSSIYYRRFPGMRSELAAPLMEDVNIRGVISVESQELNEFDNADERLITSLAALGVLTLQNAEQYQALLSTTNNLNFLYEAGRELGELNDFTQLEEAYNIVIRIAENFGQSPAIIRRYDAATEELVLVSSSGAVEYIPEKRRPANVGVQGRVAESGMTINIPDIKNLTGDIEPYTNDPKARALLVVPIKFKGRYYGNLRLGNEQPAYFGPTHEQFFEGLAQQLAVTINRLETSRDQRALEQQAQEMDFVLSVSTVSLQLIHDVARLGLIDDTLSSIAALLVDQPALSRKITRSREQIKKLNDLRDKLHQAADEARDQRASIEAPAAIAPQTLFDRSCAEIYIPKSPQQVSIDIKCPNDTAPIFVVERQIQYALRTLIINAIEAMAGKGVLTLTAVNTPDAVLLRISDNGPGITPEVQAHIFEPFYTTKKVGNLGFGLWYAKRIVEGNNGKLAVTSQLGHGATFEMRLPRAITEVEG